MKNKGQLQMSFAWIFAIIVGAFILFLAIYAGTRLIESGDTAATAKTGKEISVLLNPLETGAEEGTLITMGMPVETRIYNECVNTSVFGKQIIKVSQKSFNKWTLTDLEQSFTNKYIFSENFEEGKSFIIFAKPLEMPFKISDVVYLISSNKKYCFLDPPKRIKDEITDLDQEVIFAAETCPSNAISVCFSGSGCDVNVKEFQKSVEKNRTVMYYETDALMYAAIFSQNKLYECQVDRLMKRAKELSSLYQGKQSIVSRQGCFDNINLNSFSLNLNSFQDSDDLVSVASDANQLKIQNGVAKCKLW